MCKIVSKAILRLLFLALNNFCLLFVTKLQGRVGEKWLISGGKGENEISGESRKKRRVFFVYFDSNGANSQKNLHV